MKQIRPRRRGRAFQVNKIMRAWLDQGKRQVLDRLAEFETEPEDAPIITASRIRYEPGGKVRAIEVGGIGAMLQVARRTGVVEGIDRRLHLLKAHRPYHESDHVLKIAFNALCGGSCLEDIELRRNDEAFLDALSAKTIPDPTTAGDFCRRFTPHDVDALMAAADEARLRVWQEQPDELQGTASYGPEDRGPPERLPCSIPEVLRQESDTTSRSAPFRCARSRRR
ncbi:MAG: hypothetical protein HY812_19075 [Planctomycetes bacterium]|nr:hypothetical protein [Planctomycetota bacterium]